MKIAPNLDPFDETPQFIAFRDACLEITEPKVSAQLARLLDIGMLPSKNLWQFTDKNDIVKTAVAKCKDEHAIRTQWQMTLALKGQSTGNRQQEVTMMIQWTLLGLVMASAMRWVCGVEG